MSITYLCKEVPEQGKLVEVAPNVFWMRSPMPFKLDHINLWLIKGQQGWTVINSGMSLDSAKAVWIDVIENQLQGLPVQQVICTHMHPDHLGLAGWLADEYGATIHLSKAEYDGFIAVSKTIESNDYSKDHAFFVRGGINDKQLGSYKKFARIFKIYVSPITAQPKFLTDQQVVKIGDYHWQVVIGRGHSPEHVCLWCEQLNVFISGDQLLPTISSNISVHSDKPNADPLTAWLDSFKQLDQLLNLETLVLPAHGKPFFNAHSLIASQTQDIEKNLGALTEFCQSPTNVVEAFSVLFKTKIDSANLFMAFGESQAHLNCLLQRGLVSKQVDAQGRETYCQISNE